MSIVFESDGDPNLKEKSDVNALFSKLTFGTSSLLGTDV